MGHPAVRDQEGRVRDSYWWVNQGKTWAEERRGGYLWAPSHAPNGQTKNFWNRVLDVRIGDQVVSYCRGRVVAISMATSDGYRARRPEDLPASLWSDPGFRVDVTYHDLARPLHREDIPDVWRDASKEEPFRRDGYVKQGYLFPISGSFFAALMDLTQPAW